MTFSVPASLSLKRMIGRLVADRLEGKNEAIAHVNCARERVQGRQQRTGPALPSTIGLPTTNPWPGTRVSGDGASRGHGVRPR